MIQLHLTSAKGRSEYDKMYYKIAYDLQVKEVLPDGCSSVLYERTVQAFLHYILPNLAMSLDDEDAARHLRAVALGSLVFVYLPDLTVILNQVEAIAHTDQADGPPPLASDGSQQLAGEGEDLDAVVVAIAHVELAAADGAARTTVRAHSMAVLPCALMSTLAPRRRSSAP